MKESHRLNGKKNIMCMSNISGIYVINIKGYIIPYVQFKTECLRALNMNYKALQSNLFL